MAKIEIPSAFVEDNKGFVLKIAEPHSRKDEQGKWQTVSRTFFDVKASRDSGIDLSVFEKGARVAVWGSQKTEVREHQGKKYFTLTVWADRIEAVGASGGAAGDGWAAGAAQGVSDGFSGAQGGFEDESPF